MPFKLLPIAYAALVLAGCTGMGASPPRESAPLPPSVEANLRCGAEHVQDRVGRQYDEALGEAIHAESGAAAMRVIRPGQAVTLDYRADRLNVRLDEEDVITEIDCG